MGPHQAGRGRGPGARYLENPNLAAAIANGETTTTDATHLVRTDTMLLLRAADIGMEVPPPSPAPPAPEPGKPVIPAPVPPQYFVVMADEAPERHDLAEAGRLEVDTTIKGIPAMYADYVFPDLTYLERWADPGDVLQPAARSSPVRQPAAAPVPETVTVAGEEMPISMETVMLALTDRMGLPEFGKDGFGPGMNLTRPEDYYLKVVANLAYGDSEDGSDADAVPDADDAELEIFRAARRHLPKSVFDESRWERAVGRKLWRKVVYVLNRGGRFGDVEHGYTGEHMSHAFGGSWHLYLERVAGAKDSISGEPFDGLPRWDPPVASDGSSLEDPEYPFQLITFKESFATQSRTPGTYWAQYSLAPENFVLMSAADAERLELREGDVVRLASRTLPDGLMDLRNGTKKAVEGKVKVLQGLRPGVVAVSHHFGHWAYGATDVVVDGVVMPGDERRGRGLPVNALMRLDDHMRTGPVTDPLGGSVSFYDTKVKLLPA